ncbi:MULTISPECIES: ABC transporter permease [Clostridium]|uniref:ABC transporter permease n=1 Tax=Clostridium lapidicellarium TaxID=3240931 RepID=A0ABV4DYF7_9CLOT|nr:ABC transporter permease [uncultured Clostridium sp.]
MNLLELIHSAVLSLRTHKLRVFLTMIGIIIGISSVVVILSVGEGLKAQVNQSTEDTGANAITVNFEPYDLNSSDASTAFNRKDFQDLKDIDGVEQVNKSSSGLEGLTGVIESATFFNKQSYLTVNDYDRNAGVVSGRGITREDNDFKHYVVVLSKDHAKALFGNNVNEGIGKGIKIKDEYFEVVGIGKEGSGLLAMQYDYVPEFAKNLLENDTVISSIDVNIKQGYNSDSIFKKVKKELEILHPDVKGTYTKGDPKAVSKAFEKIISGITTFIAVVSGISLFVGGIGVMNIMYVSVTERRREIGIRRAIGAKPSAILYQFLIESIFITGMGGILGIGTGYLASLILGNFLPFKPVMTLGILAGSSITSIAVGIIFGIIPAYKAAKLDPIKAIYR